MQRIIGLDYLRVTTVLIVFLFHAWMHLGCSYGVFTSYISVGAVYMSLFFMLSGYVLCLKYMDNPWDKPGALKEFYLKRLISIIPAYWTVALLFEILLGSEPLSQKILLIPIELLGLQSIFSSLFSYSHNGGTWFVSCLLLCYLICPFVIFMTRRSSDKGKLIFVLFAFCVLLWSPWVVCGFDTHEIYTNPLIRSLEFALGVVLASWLSKFETKRWYKWCSQWPVRWCGYLLSFLWVTLLIKLSVPHVMYMAYSSLLLPIFCFLLIAHSYNVEGGGPLLRYSANISYCFFLVQMFIWQPTKHIVTAIGMNGNVPKLLVAFSLCFLFSVLLHEIVEKPVARRAKLLMKR